MNLEQPENTPLNTEVKHKVWEAPVLEVIEYEQTQFGGTPVFLDGASFPGSH